MTISRRGFLKGAGAIGGVVIGSSVAEAAAPQSTSDVEFNGMLIDTTMCVGCRACEAACNEENKLPKPEIDLYSEAVFAQKRDTTPDAFTVTNRFENPKDPKEPFHVRKQCFHCNQPGCASACLVKALEKTPEGPVIYNKDRCLGCRYCMISCPFDAPKYQYDSNMPYLRKCIFCAERQKEGKPPACAEACPTGATQYGKKRTLLAIARERLAKEPDRYHQRIYGEHEVGGTGWLFLTGVEPKKVDLLEQLGTRPYPELTSGFLSGVVPKVFVLWPSVLFGLNAMTKGDDKQDHDAKGGESHDE